MIRLIIFTLSALLAFAVAEREFNLCAREEKARNRFRPNWRLSGIKTLGVRVYIAPVPCQ